MLFSRSLADLCSPDDHILSGRLLWAPMKPSSLLSRRAVEFRGDANFEPPVPLPEISLDQQETLREQRLGKPLTSRHH
jgi:hypothetical protein